LTNHRENVIISIVRSNGLLPVMRAKPIWIVAYTYFSFATGFIFLTDIRQDLGKKELHGSKEDNQ